jgi:hypothetical protein
MFNAAAQIQKKKKKKKAALKSETFSRCVFYVFTSSGSGARARALKSSMRRKSSTRFHLYDSFIWLRLAASIAKGVQ